MCVCVCVCVWLCVLACVCVCGGGGVLAESKLENNLRPQSIQTRKFVALIGFKGINDIFLSFFTHAMQEFMPS